MIQKNPMVIGFIDVNTTDDGKIMKGTFYDNRDGKDNDHFTITK
jgi:hypothetical protein